MINLKKTEVDMQLVVYNSLKLSLKLEASEWHSFALFDNSTAAASSECGCYIQAFGQVLYARMKQQMYVN